MISCIVDGNVLYEINNCNRALKYDILINVYMGLSSFCTSILELRITQVRPKPLSSTSLPISY
jgi:hypothetical protein